MPHRPSLYRRAKVAATYVALVVLSALAACSDRSVSAPAGGQGVASAAVTPVALLQCVAQVASRDVSCRSVRETTPSGAAHDIIGGQNIYVRLTSSNVTYSLATGIFQFDVTVQDLMPESLGTPGDEAVGTHVLDANGIRVFFNVLPVATGGSGLITVLNPDGVGTFTGTNQPYYQYNEVLVQNAISGSKQWRFNVPSTVTTFGFFMYISTVVKPALVIDEILANPGGTISDANGEWFEVYNAGVRSVDLKGYTISDSSSTTRRPYHTIASTLVVPPGGYVVFGNTTNTTLNGGVIVDYAYNGALSLADDEADAIKLSSPIIGIDSTTAKTINRVSYVNALGISAKSGISRELRNPALPNGNTDDGNWTDGSVSYGPGGTGSPGAANTGYASVPPSAATIGVVTTGNGQLTVAFTAPSSDGGSPITNYEYSTDNGATWTTRSPSATTSPIVITGLTNGTTYQVRIRALNAAGTGTMSAAAPGTPTTTPGAPSISSITPGNGQLSVALTAPASTGGTAITNYEYSTDNGVTWLVRSPAATTSPLVITGLINGTTYAVRLRAVNAVGSGTQSTALSGTPATVPDAPTNLVATAGLTNAALTWTAPASSGGSAITTYVVEFSANGGTSWSPFAHSASTATAITVTGLTNGTAYQFRVSATNALGTGATSGTASATPGTPGAPTGATIAFNQQSSTALDGLFSWTAPASSGASAITDYVIEYKTSASVTWTTFAHSASTLTTATVPGLVPSTTYNVRISAKNAVGTGAPSAVATATTNGPSSRLSCFQPGNSNSSANSIVIAPCAGTQLGNVILIPVTIGNSSATTVVTISQMAGTSGFTSLGTELNGSNQTTIFYKIADATDVGRVATYGFSWTGNVKNAITLVAYKTTDGAAPNYLSTNGTGITATSPAVTVSGSTSYTLVYIYTMAGVAMSSTTPSVGEWTVSSELWKNTTAGANNALAAAISTTDVDKFASATTPPRSATTSSMTVTTKWNAAVLVLRSP
ncbi:MAG: fibronectin type III domain-containing protein [bacterium]